ncbi:hypothetical protein COT42_05690 [Candidatus Saganbacteria bacterium CG08_land_8_20_14_0_20_45_16]|uniref:Uncharacterized protein n=1 Tax=Candidatus Saganbacteria bacterium CG08_land_8_20_14_0_20_45_16 TaxID=2014293 RepID=A0A2H0XWN1_UNCSA|nr:MAG: hypothetical protein COT42_05690 [Candidatus Saganbacteria bacterium CG08_land_8_20_14_0_20_45_16]
MGLINLEIHRMHRLHISRFSRVPLREANRLTPDPFFTPNEVRGLVKAPDNAAANQAAAFLSAQLYQVLQHNRQENTAARQKAFRWANTVEIKAVTDDGSVVQVADVSPLVRADLLENATRHLGLLPPEEEVVLAAKQELLDRFQDIGSIDTSYDPTIWIDLDSAYDNEAALRLTPAICPRIMDKLGLKELPKDIIFFDDRELKKGGAISANSDRWIRRGELILQAGQEFSASDREMILVFGDILSGIVLGSWKTEGVRAILHDDFLTEYGAVIDKLSDESIPTSCLDNETLVEMYHKGFERAKRVKSILTESENALLIVLCNKRSLSEHARTFGNGKIFSDSRFKFVFIVDDARTDDPFFDKPEFRAFNPISLEYLPETSPLDAKKREDVKELLAILLSPFINIKERTIRALRKMVQGADITLELDFKNQLLNPQLGGSWALEDRAFFLDNFRRLDRDSVELVVKLANHFDGPGTEKYDEALHTEVMLTINALWPGVISNNEIQGYKNIYFEVFEARMKNSIDTASIESLARYMKGFEARVPRDDGYIEEIITRYHEYLARLPFKVET